MSQPEQSDFNEESMDWTVDDAVQLQLVAEAIRLEQALEHGDEAVINQIAETSPTLCNATHVLMAIQSTNYAMAHTLLNVKTIQGQLRAGNMLNSLAFEAAEAGEAVLLQQITSIQDQSPAFFFKDGERPIHVACRKGYPRIVDWLLWERMEEVPSHCFSKNKAVTLAIGCTKPEESITILKRMTCKLSGLDLLKTYAFDVAVADRPDVLDLFIEGVDIPELLGSEQWAVELKDIMMQVLGGCGVEVLKRFLQHYADFFLSTEVVSEGLLQLGRQSGTELSKARGLETAKVLVLSGLPVDPAWLEEAVKEVVDADHMDLADFFLTLHHTFDGRKFPAIDTIHSAHMFRLLHMHGLDPDEKLPNGDPVLYAIAKGFRDTETYAELFEDVAAIVKDVDQVGKDGLTPLGLLANNGIPIVGQCCEGAGVVLHRDPREKPFSPPMVLRLMKFLLNWRARVNYPNEGGRSILHLAVSMSYPSVVELLLEHNADVHAKTMNQGDTPLHQATSCCTESRFDGMDKINLLIRYGADPDATNARGEYALYIPGDISAFASNTDDTVNFIRDMVSAYETGKRAQAVQTVDFKAFMSRMDRFGSTALVECVAEFDRCSWDVIEALIKAGADVNQYTAKDNVNAPGVALQNGDVAFFKRLLSYGADINSYNRKGKALIDEADSPEMVQFLLENGARRAEGWEGVVGFSE